jgi:hypothetical protein
MTERRKLVREEPRSPTPVSRAARRRDERDDSDDDDDRVVRSRGRRQWTRGRPPLSDEVGDVGRGSLFVGIESAAIALDTIARVLRGAVDRAFDEDYDRPGDVVRGIAGEADLAAYDLASELRNVPRRLSRRFDEALRSPRADRGERDRRDNGTPADSPRVGSRARLRRDEE